MDDEARGRLRFRPLSGNPPSNDVVMDTDTSQQDGHSEVGKLLRSTRIGLGQSIEDVCRMLRIRKIYIEAIESSDYAVLPNGPYGLGFVKAYAEHLGLDGAEIARRYREESNAPAVRTELTFPKPVQESRVPGAAVLLIAVMLGLGAYGGWYYLSSQGKTIADLVDPLPERLASYTNNDSTSASDTEPRNLENAADAQAAEAEEPAADNLNQAVTGETSETAAQTDAAVPADDVAAAPSEPAAETADVADTTDAVDTAPAVESPAVESEEPAAQAEAPAQDAVASSEQSAEVAQSTEPTEPAEPTPEVAETQVPAGGEPAAEEASVPEAPTVDEVGGARVFGAVNVDSRVTISAVETSWVRIRESDGNVLLTRMLTAGDTYRVPNRDGLKLEVGNAGALTYSIDGEDAQPVGDYGAVISDFSLDISDLSAEETPATE
ncbi:DUF4115 domain-containing protein [Thalassospira sp. MA62]|nr:DUF4115 domain-containing protein [Thalassospira sp. MA62]